MISLSFEQAPPFPVVLRFFLTAPVFAVIAGICLWYMADGAVDTPFAPYLIGALHCFTIGFILMLMCGAMFQLLPVAVGANIPYPQHTGWLVYLALTIGAGCLVLAFFTASPILFAWAASTLAVGLAVFIVMTGWALWRTSARSTSLFVLRIALAGLVVAMGFGLLMALAYAGIADLAWLQWRSQHFSWVIAGWGLMLVMGVAYLVIPMFQLTGPYPARSARWVPFSLAVGLMLMSALHSVVGISVIFLSASIWFVVQSIRLQAARRRPKRDASFLFWQVGFFSLLIAAVLSVLIAGDWLNGESPVWWYAGVSLFHGFFASIMMGMSYKIIPFLVWLHVQKILGRGPNMNVLIPEKWQSAHWQLHLVTLCFMLAAGSMTYLVTVAAMLWITDFVVLFALLCKAVLVWRSQLDSK